jgi:hypothetical protein
MFCSTVRLSLNGKSVTSATQAKCDTRRIFKINVTLAEGSFIACETTLWLYFPLIVVTDVAFHLDKWRSVRTL